MLYIPDGLASFACEGEGLAPEDSALHPDYCLNCTVPFRLDMKHPAKVIEHLSAHLLFDIKLQNSQPCCFCLQPSPMCSIYLKNGCGQKGMISIDKTCSHGCCNLLTSFNYNRAAESTVKAPCSNVPIICPCCSSDQPAIWWYNFEAHFKTHHANDDFKQFSNLYSIMPKEKAAMHELWNSWVQVADSQHQRHKRTAKSMKTSKVLSANQVLIACMYYCMSFY